MIIGYNSLENLEYNKETKIFFHKKIGKKFKISERLCLNCRQEFLEEINDPYPVSRFYCSPRCMKAHIPFVKLTLEFVGETLNAPNGIIPLFTNKEKVKNGNS